jgi:hypothetical protein
MQSRGYLGRQVFQNSKIHESKIYRAPEESLRGNRGAERKGCLTVVRMQKLKKKQPTILEPSPFLLARPFQMNQSISSTSSKLNVRGDSRVPLHLPALRSGQLGTLLEFSSKRFQGWIDYFQLVKNHYHCPHHLRRLRRHL